MITRQVIGLASIFCGLALIVLALGNLIFRFAIAVIGFLLINYGLRLRNQSPVFIWAQRTFYRM